MTNIVLLGASGSIGTQVINVIRNHPYDFKLVGISTYNSEDFINDLLIEFNTIKAIGIVEENKKIDFENVFNGIDCNINLINYFINAKDILVVNAISGIDGLYPLIYAIECDFNVALANKESVVCGGDLLFDILNKHPNVSIFPIDSEHNAIFQCLVGENYEDIDELIITASGGPFRNSSLEELKNVSKNAALSHPTWKMGPKISIDSATMFNKGLEIIEAHYLFGIEYEKIKAIIHPQSLIHGLVKYKDGFIKAIMSTNNMEHAILYAISNGNRKYYSNENLDLTKIKDFEFYDIDLEKFPAVKLAYKVGKIGGSYPTIYCVANEIAVNAFLKDKIKFLDIYKVVEKVIENSNCEYHYPLSRLYEIIDNTIIKTHDVINSLKGDD